MSKQKKNNFPRILIVDIENAPNLASIWQLKTEYVAESMVEMPWYLLTWSAKWYHEKEVMCGSLIEFSKEYKKNPEDDKRCLQKLLVLLNEADIVIGHNVDYFDCRKINARLIMNNLLPPSPYRTVDTLKIARHYFMFTSNKLNDLAKYLKIGAKVETGGYELWRECMSGNKTAWEKMIKYNKNDVILSEKVYDKMLPYIKNHPNLGAYLDDSDDHCRLCGSIELVKQGFAYTNNAKYQQYSCKNCGGWSRGKKNLKENKVTIA